MSSNGSPLKNPIRTPDSPPSTSQDRHVTWDSSMGIPPPSIESEESSTKVLAPPQIAVTPHMPSVRAHIPVEPLPEVANADLRDIEAGLPDPSGAATEAPGPVAPPPPVASPRAGLKVLPSSSSAPASPEMATMVPPPPSPPPPTSSASAGDGNKQEEIPLKETIGTRFLDVAFGGISFIIIFMAFSLYLISQRIDFWALSIGMDRELRALPECTYCVGGH